MLPSFALVLTAAGLSERFNRDGKGNKKKEFELLGKETVLKCAAKPFFMLPSLQRVVVTSSEGFVDETRFALGSLLDSDVPIDIIIGGKTRQESVRLALENLEKHSSSFEFVAIHDGARPYVSTELIESTLQKAMEVGGAVPGLPMTDSIRKTDGSGIIIECQKRDMLYRVQTPQIFRFSDILSAHRRFTDVSATDDSELYILSGKRCAVCKGDAKNVKITYPEDLSK